MPLTPGYGETPLPDDELAALLPDVVLMLGKPVTRAVRSTTWSRASSSRWPRSS